MRCGSCWLHIRRQLIERRGTRGSPSWHDVAHQCLAFHDAYVWFFADRDQIVHYISLHPTAIAPMIGKSDLVHAPSVHPERMHSTCDQDSRLNNAARRRDGSPPTVLKPSFLRQLWRHFREQ